MPSSRSDDNALISLGIVGKATYLAGVSSGAFDGASVLLALAPLIALMVGGFLSEQDEPLFQRAGHMMRALTALTLLLGDATVGGMLLLGVLPRDWTLSVLLVVVGVLP